MKKSYTILFLLFSFSTFSQHRFQRTFGTSAFDGSSAHPTTVGGYNTWTNYASDRRVKKNINENVPGLNFIMKLRPVTYNVDAREIEHIRGIADSIIEQLKDSYDKAEQKRHTGFIAQEVDSAAQELGYDFDGVYKPQNEKDNYGLSYESFIMPLVKAIQDLSKTVDSLKAVQSGQRIMNDGQGSNETISQVELANKGNVILYQNEPNPFDGSTAIRYFIPENISGSAFVVFYDMYGNEVNKLEIKERGFGKIEANTENLASGVYSYSIVVDGKSIDTKKMIRNK